MIIFPSKFQFKQDISTFEDGVKVFSDVVIAGERSVIISSKDSKIIFCKGREYQMRSTIPKILYWSRTVNKRVLCFPGFNHRNWYHVVADIGFQIFLAKQKGLVDAIVLPLVMKEISQSFMQFIKLFDMDIFFMGHSRKAFKAKEVVFFDKNTGRLSEAIKGGVLDTEINGYFDFLNQCFLELNWVKKKEFGNKIFSTRTGNDSRVYEKLTEIESEYQGLGYQIIHFNKMSLFEQMAIMQNVTHFAGFHGANLMNMIFANQCQEIVELVNIELSDDFKTIAKFKGISYTRRNLQ